MKDYPLTTPAKPATRSFAIGWGTGIALFYSLFAVTMIGMVVASRQHNPGLVQPDYYDLDLNYQARLEQKQHTAALPVLPTVQYQSDSDIVDIALPPGQTATKGVVRLYRAVNTTDDLSIPFEHNTAVQIPAATLVAGRWLVELEWEADGKSFFWETSIFII
jgi:nitrogen fixation protein FixH